MEKVGLVGAEMAFGTVQHVFQTLYEGRAVALGYMRYHRFMELAVPQHKKLTWAAGDRIVVIIRKVLGDEDASDDEYEGKRGSVTTLEEAKAIAAKKEQRDATEGKKSAPPPKGSAGSKSSTKKGVGSSI